MSFFISKMILHNRAPFDYIELDFEDKTINVLHAINGGGKTTILSHITDAWFEIVRLVYGQEFAGKENKYYRISSNITSINNAEPSIVYIRFTDNTDYVDYIDVRGNISDEDYNEIIKLENKINYQSFAEDLKEQNNIKYVNQHDKKPLQDIFDNNIVTSFPAYRYEEPGYLNDPFKVKLNYKLKSDVSGYLRSPIEVISGLPELANWLMDIILDRQVQHETGVVESSVFDSLNEIFRKSLCSKNDKLSIGIGARNQGAMRIQIGERNNEGRWLKTVYPSIFNMSSGENALICIFCELVRQFDNIATDASIKSAYGIVLIDEVDKHLHIKLQKEILPKLFAMFPNVQFIISTHSPFVTMGLIEQQKSRTKIVDLAHGGITILPEENDQYKEVYNMMISENERFFDAYKKLASASADENKLLIVTEGHNVVHIKKAIDILKPELASKIKYVEGLEGYTGKDQLLAMYRYEICKGSGNILFVFDCDAKAQVDGAQNETEKIHKFSFEKNTKNDKVKKGIENLYSKSLFTKDLYISRVETDCYGAKKTIGEFNKNAFLEKIESKTKSNVFKNFQPLINKISEITSKLSSEIQND